MVSAILIVVVIILIAAGAFYFLSQTNKPLTNELHKQTGTTTAISATTTTSTSANFLRRKFYINFSSGTGLIWFDNSTITNVRDGIYAWQYATNNLIQFTEVNNSNADIAISFTSGINQTATSKTIGETYSREGLIKGSIQIVPQGPPCRNIGIIMHEIGHIIGLDHNETNRFDIMYPLQSYGCDQNISSYDSEQAKKLIEELIS